MALTKEQIIAANDLQQKRVTVPEWGGDVIVRALKACEKDAIEAHMVRVKQSGGDLLDAVKSLRPLVLSMALVDDTGAHLFPGEEGQNQLGEKNGRIIERLYKEAADLGAMDAGVLEEEVKK